MTATCKIPGCIRVAVKAGMCSAHRRRMQRGRPLLAPIVCQGGPERLPDPEGVFGALTRERMDAHVSPEPMSGCWLWTGTVDQNGYGMMTLGGVRGLRAHRVAWMIANGPIPSGLFICHRCDNPACVNPAHLFAGTHRDNMKDKAAKGRACSPTRLRPADVLAIREAVERGDLQRVVAARYGVHAVTVGKIVRGERWQSIAARRALENA